LVHRWYIGGLRSTRLDAFVAAALGPPASAAPVTHVDGESGSSLARRADEERALRSFEEAECRERESWPPEQGRRCR